MDLKTRIRDVPDFPKPGIVFKDITPLLADPEALAETEEAMAAPFRDAGVTAVAGIESRGFIFGALLARRLGVGFLPIRKQGKLPAETHRVTYTLEYGDDVLEIHRDAAGPGDRVLIVDDLLATGGTAAATARLVEATGAEVAGLVFLVELTFLGGRRNLEGRRVVSLLEYGAET
jgi:adenine phosphoribosyltransferase